MRHVGTPALYNLAQHVSASLAGLRLCPLFSLYFRTSFFVPFHPFGFLIPQALNNFEGMKGQDSPGTLGELCGEDV